MALDPHSIALIETWRLGFLASTGPDGRPNVSPKGTFVVLDPGTIAFAEMRSPGTMRNLQTMPEIEVNFVDILSRRGIRIRSRAEICPRGTPEFAELLPAFSDLWPDLLAKFNAIIRLPISQLRPLQSPAYETGTTEAELRDLWKRKIGEMP